MLKKSLVVILTLSIVLVVSVAAWADTKPSPSPEALSLEKCLDLAAASSQQVKSAAKNVEIAQESVKQAEAGFWPTVNYQFASSLYSQDTSTIFYVSNPNPPLQMGTVTVDGPNQNYGGSIKLTQPLYTGGKLTLGLEMAKLQMASAQEEERKAKQTLAYNVRAAYYQVWLGDQMLKVVQASYDNMGHHVKQVEHFYQVGTASKFELLRAQVQHEGLKPLVIKAENGLVLAKLNLATLIGYPRDHDFTVSYDPLQLKLPEKLSFSTALLDQAYQNRPEMKEVKILGQVAEYSEKMTAAGYKPNVALTGSYDGRGNELLPGNWNKSWSLTVGVSGLIYDGKATQSKIAAAKDQRDLVALRESGLKDQIRFEVEQSEQGLQEALETIRSTQANTDLCKESLRLTQARFDAGMATTMDIMDAQLALDQALNGYYLGISAYLTALAKIDLVSGK